MKRALKSSFWNTEAWKSMIMHMANHAYIPPFILLFGLIISLLISGYIYIQAYERDIARFDVDVETSKEVISGTIDNYIALLDAQAGYITAENTEVTSSEFYRFAERLNLKERYRGIQGLGLTVRISPDEKSQFISLMQQKWGPDFQIRPTYERNEYHSIMYISPLDKRNQAAIGYDMFSDPTRREAMIRARDNGIPALSGKVRLVQEIDEQIQPGFLLYVPIYRYPNIPETIQERQNLLYGYAYSAFRAHDFFNSITLNSINPNIHIAIYDGNGVDESRLLYSSGDESDLSTLSLTPSFTSTKYIDIAGNTWTMVVRNKINPINDIQYINPAYVLLGGLLFSLSLYALSRLQYRAQRLATKAESQLAHRLQIQQSITFLGQQSLADTPMDRLMNSAVRMLVIHLKVDFTKVLELKPDKRNFVLRAGYGWSNSIKVNKTTVPANNTSQAGFTLLSKKPVVVEDLLTETRFNTPHLLASHGVRSGISVIIYGKDGSHYGILSAHSTHERHFSSHDIEFIQALANILSLSIQRNQTEKERAKYEKQKDEFIAVASHELKTPVTSIKAFAHVLLSQFSKKENLHAVNVLKRLNNQVDRLTFLVSSLLDISKIEAGQLEFNYSWFDYDQMVSDTTQALQLTNSTHRIMVNNNQNARVYADKDRIEQVLTNLINNAVKYSNQGTEIIISSEIDGNFIKTSVTDAGIGISEKEFTHIFDRFYRVNEKETQTFSGLGLGLYISAQIIKRLNGTINVESKPKKGSIFTYRIPIKPKTYSKSK